MHFAAKALSPSELELSWDPPRQPNGQITKYKVCYWVSEAFQRLSLQLLIKRLADEVSNEDNYCLTSASNTGPLRGLRTTTSSELENGSKMSAPYCHEKLLLQCAHARMEQLRVAPTQER